MTAVAEPDPGSVVRDNAKVPVPERVLIGLLIAYIVGASIVRFIPNLQPYTAETDWKQWVWQYWRYHVEGAFPAGHPMTDYTFNAQPPLYHAVMAVLSSVFVPTVAANIVNWIAWVCGITGVALAVRARANWALGFAAAALFVRDDVVYRFTAGGYPRSFGPALTALFLAALLSKRRRLAILVLVLSSAIYPSIVVPCGLALGLWTLATTPRTSFRTWLMPNLEVIAAGLVIVVIAQWQSVTAPDWWGPVVWAKDAGIELSSRGRTGWLPLGPFWPRVHTYIVASFGFSGHATGASALSWSENFTRDVVGGWFVVLAVVAVVRRRSLRSLPLEVLLTFCCCVIAFWLARVFAFKLYLPHRMVQHTLSVVAIIAAGIVSFECASAFIRAPVRRTVLALAFLLVPIFALSGDGIGGGGFKSYARNKPLFQWIEKNTAIGDQFAGHYWIMDEIPLFAKRQSYVGWKMAHPFRKGYFAEVERRTHEMYGAIYATDLADVLAFAQKTNVSWMIVDSRLFEKLESGDGQLFEPLRSHIDKVIFRPGKEKGFVLADPPAEIIAFKHRPYVVISIAALREHLGAPFSP